MGITDTFGITGSALSAQSVHIDMIARNMANAQVVSGSAQSAYRAQRPEFSAILNSQFGQGMANNSIFNGKQTDGVMVSAFNESQAPIERQRMPESPMADADGFVYLSNVNMVEEMAFMMEASRSYQSNVEVMNTAKQLMLSTLSIGK